MDAARCKIVSKPPATENHVILQLRNSPSRLAADDDLMLRRIIAKCLRGETEPVLKSLNPLRGTGLMEHVISQN